jgi:phosphomannomutase
LSEDNVDALMIGVSGMRGTVGGTLTPPVVVRMVGAFVSWLRARRGADAPLKVVFGRDSRPSGPWLRDATIATLAAGGCEVIDLDIVTTPGVAMMVRHLGADAGIVATASHNPIRWNGLKFLDYRGVAPPAADAAAIRDLFEQGSSSVVAVDRLMPVRKDSQTHALHTRTVLARVDALGISSRRYKVVLDSVNGAGCVGTAMLLSKLGCNLIHLNSTPDGKFPHDPEPTEANLQQLASEVRRQNANVGFAQDPDADRLAIVDERGVYIGEEYSLALCVRWMLSRRPGVVVSNLSTSRMIDDLAARYGCEVLRTPVGEANVIEVMLQNGAVIGGEGNGGVIDPAVVPGRDSMVGMAYVLQLMLETGKSVSQLVEEIPRYRMIKTKFPCRREAAQRAVEAIRDRITDARIDLQDGVRVDWEDSWVHARASNTEPIMRIIAEASTLEIAEARIDYIRRIVQEAGVS